MADCQGKEDEEVRASKCSWICSQNPKEQCLSLHGLNVPKPSLTHTHSRSVGWEAACSSGLKLWNPTEPDLSERRACAVNLWLAEAVRAPDYVRRACQQQFDLQSVSFLNARHGWSSPEHEQRSDGGSHAAKSLRHVSARQKHLTRACMILIRQVGAIVVNQS